MARGHILLIDDDQTILALFRASLEKAGYQVTIAPDGQAGVKAFQEQKPDLAIVDIAMPGIDGYQVIELMRISEGGAGKAPVIVLTAHEQGVMRDYASEIGADIYLTKPIAPTVLVEHIEALLAQARK